MMQNNTSYDNQVKKVITHKDWESLETCSSTRVFQYAFWQEPWDTTAFEKRLVPFAKVLNNHMNHKQVAIFAILSKPIGNHWWVKELLYNELVGAFTKSGIIAENEIKEAIYQTHEHWKKAWRDNEHDSFLLDRRGIILVCHDNSLFVGHWGPVMLIMYRADQARILKPCDMKQMEWLKQTKISNQKQHQTTIQSFEFTSIPLDPWDEFIVVSSQNILEWFSVESIKRVVCQSLRKKKSPQKIAELFVKTAKDLGCYDELVFHLIILRKPEWTCDLSVHNGNVFTKDYVFHSLSSKHLHSTSKESISSLCKEDEVMTSRTNSPSSRCLSFCSSTDSFLRDISCADCSLENKCGQWEEISSKRETDDVDNKGISKPGSYEYSCHKVQKHDVEDYFLELLQCSDSQLMSRKKTWWETCFSLSNEKNK